MTIKPAFAFGELVYHITDADQQKGVVLNYEVLPKGLKYVVSFNGVAESFYVFELAPFKDEGLPPKKEDEEDE